MAELSANKMEVNTKHTGDVQKAKHSLGSRGGRFSYSGRGAQTGVVVGSNKASPAIRDASVALEHTGHFEASSDIQNDVNKVVSQLDQLKAKIARERRTIMEKKRAKR